MANAFIDRRDLTDQRNMEARGQQPGSMHPLRTVETNLAAIASDMVRVREALIAGNRGDRAEITQLCVTDREPAQAVQSNFPVPRAKRFIVRRTGQGGTYSIPATTPTLLVAANEARLGGTIVNSGNGAVTLVLTTDLLNPGGGQPLSAGAPQLWLSAGGGAWDFLLGHLLWCGNVIAYASGATTMTVAEV